MSFDPITGIWAANKAAEIVGGSGGSSIPKLEITSAEYPMESATSVQLSAEETAQLKAAIETGSPCIVHLKVDGMPFSIMCDNFFGIMLIGYVKLWDKYFQFSYEDGIGTMGG